jgi:hypothetical protein
MPMTSDDDAVIARFEIRRRAYLGPGGEVRTSLPAFATPPSALIPLYEAMVLNRAACLSDSHPPEATEEILE